MYLRSIGTNLARKPYAIFSRGIRPSKSRDAHLPMNSHSTFLLEPINSSIASRGIQDLNPFRIRYFVHVIVLVSLSIVKQHREDIGNLAPSFLCCRREVG